MVNFAHLHCHTQYSLLDGASNIPKLMKHVAKSGMQAIAISDHGNMFGVPSFYYEAKKNGIQPIIGCEFYLSPTTCQDKSPKLPRYHQLLLAKNITGYKNLIKLNSIAYQKGFYRYPRIDKALIQQYHEGLIATTCCLAAEIPSLIIAGRIDDARKAFEWWLGLFKDDYYIEIQRHPVHEKGLDDLPEQKIVNQVLLEWSKLYGVKVIATNDAHYITEQDAAAHDVLLCIQTDSELNQPNRFRFEGNQFYVKTPEEMQAVFPDLPEALENTQEIVEKTKFDLPFGDILLPQYQLPEGFKTEDEYLAYLAYEGAKIRYQGIPPEVENRLQFELQTIKQMGYAGYFLIVQDFINAARKLGVMVGLGRGSAAGSLVAYCTGITNIDPIKYDLLFERFLNPERVSMPDIDTDFDDVGRQKVIEYVIQKYGRQSVCQIVTFGTMGLKTAIKDVGRVIGIPLSKTNEISKWLDDLPLTLPDGETEFSYAMKHIPEFAQARATSTGELKKLFDYAEVLEGSVRQTGIHAAGVIIAPGDVSDYVPLFVQRKDNEEIIAVQYDGKYIEKAGLLKMDFLGLATLTIIKDCLNLIKKRHGIEIDIDKIPLDDPKTYKLYQQGNTIATFQFESEGMRQYLRQLKPTNIEDLIAMNALYRPGPLQYIPSYIARKHGKEKPEYPHECLIPILEKTYGIMVYQEQIMQTAQVMAGYSLGGADLLRRAMGKKDAKEMERQESIFVEGAIKKGIDEATARKTFAIMKKFAEYGFNRSHSAAYSILAYQTAYLKANYPAEYMASVLTNNMNNMDKLSFYLAECKSMGLEVLGPDINESEYAFTVNEKGQIRYGLGGLKNVGGAAIEAILQERNKNGKFKDVFDFVSRVDLRLLNKRCMESFVQSGTFDSFGIERERYFASVSDKSGTIPFLERILRYGNKVQTDKHSQQNSLFDTAGDNAVAELAPSFPQAQQWSILDKLNKEKEILGIYLSGHPLDPYRLEIHTLNCSISKLETLKSQKYKQDIRLIVMVEDAVKKQDKNGNPYLRVVLSDFESSTEITLFSKQYAEFANYMEKGQILYIVGRLQPRYKDSQELEFFIQKVEFMADVVEKIKTLHLEVELDKITKDFTENVEKIVNQHKGGDTYLYFTIVDESNSQKIVGYSKKYQVKLTPALKDFFIKELGIEKCKVVW
ncbi:MAG: DNA polymerase III subunit alpha [Bacteroidia bacterium]|nr:DNA polymerase III subunit alpha [Bacteroidia bacterium]MDW8300943.1 DNA polymerase III subunit alpha [Bacteroidia bacterium]